MTYPEVIKYIEDVIETEKLDSGSRLPSIRTLSKQLNCNKETVMRAYQKLEEQHLIYVIGQSGYYLLQERKEDEKKDEILDFQTVNPDANMLPYREFQHCINQAIENDKKALFVYGETNGLMSLRKELVKHLKNAQVFANEDQIFVTSGSQQALSILFHMEYPNYRSKILIEQPTYGLINRMLEMQEERFVGIARTEQGIDLKELENIFRTKEIMFFYCIPRNHNPLGTNLTNEQKEAIVKLANKYGVYIIEDDYLSDMNVTGNELPMHYYDTTGRVIYVKSYAKAFLPGVRLGIAVLPKTCCSDFYHVKRMMDLNTSQLEQAALEIFLKSGMYNHHIEKMRKAYKDKVNYIKQYLQSMQGICNQFIVDESGFFVWIPLYDRIREDVLESRLKEKGVLVTVGKNFYFRKHTNAQGIRICIARYKKEEVCRGIGIIINEISKFHGK